MIRKLDNIKGKYIGLFLYMITFLFFLFFALQISTPYLVDETGTIAFGAYLAGYDWSSTVYSMGSYSYKYLQGLFYLPVLLWIHNPDFIYKGILIIQGLFYSTIPVFVFYLLIRFFSQKKSMAIIVALAIAFLPTPFLLSFYTTSDLFLTILPWPILILLCFSLENKDKKKKILYSGLLAILSVVAYMAHSRGIVITLGLCIFLIFTKLRYKKSLVHFPTYFLILFGLLILDKFINTNFKELLYTFGVRTANADKITGGILFKILEPDGFMVLLKLLIGWFYAFISSGYFIVVIGLCVPFILKPKKLTMEKVVANFSFIIFFLAFLVGIIWMYYSATVFFLENNSMRADRIIYTRYLSSVLGPIFLLGLYYILKGKEKKKASSIALIATAFVCISFFYLVIPSFKEIHIGILTTNVMSILPFLQLGVEDSFGQLLNFYEACLITLVMIMILAIILYWSIRKGKKRFILILLLVCFLINIHLSFYNIRYVESKKSFEDMKDVTTYVSKFPKDISTQYSDILLLSNPQSIRAYQVSLKEYHFYNDFEYLDDQNIFIILSSDNFEKLKQGRVYFSSRNFEDLKNQTYYLFKDFHSLKDVILIKGEKIKEKFEKYGYEFEKLEV